MVLRVAHTEKREHLATSRSSSTFNIYFYSICSCATDFVGDVKGWMHMRLVRRLCVGVKPLISDGAPAQQLAQRSHGARAAACALAGLCDEQDRLVEQRRRLRLLRP